MTLWRYINQRAWLAICRSGLANLLTDEQFARGLMFFWLGKKVNLRNPRDYNEKLQWLKLHYRNPLMPICADKYGVREYVKERIGAKYLNNIIGVYDRVDDIDFDRLPNRFVLKATHGSSWNIICNDKKNLDVERSKKAMRRWLVTDFSKYGREWQYHEIRPRIVCEEFLENSSGEELKDYKLLTFAGKTKYIWVDHRDERGCQLRSFFDTDWKFQDDKGHLYPNGHAEYVPRPKCLEEMLLLAKKLASDFPQCRVDFYILDNKRVVFGEMTFSSANGCNPFYPQSFCDELGDCMRLPTDYLIGIG